MGGLSRTGVPERYHNVITPRSELAIKFCEIYLEQAANYFLEEPFSASALVNFVHARTYEYEAGREVYLSFQVSKLEDPHDLDDGEQSSLGFCIIMSEKAKYKKGTYWPGIGKMQLAPGDEVMSEATEIDDDEAPPGHIAIDFDECYVQQTISYGIDQDEYTPRIDLEWEYFDSEESDVPVAKVLADVPDALDATVLSDDKNHDAILRTLDASMTQTFSESDVKIIVNILKRLGFKNDFHIEEQT